jgi:hypothetical protein
MNKIKHKLAIEFLRLEIKKISNRIKINKQALRNNQRSASLGQPQVAEYDKSESNWYCAEYAIYSAKKTVTAFLIVYAEIRGKLHLPEERIKDYAGYVEAARKRMDEYVEKKQVALL